MKIDYPVTFIWPADTQVGLPAGRWRRLADGRIEAVYESQQELGLCLMFASVSGRNGASDAMWEKRADAILRDWRRRGWVAGPKQEGLW